MKINMDSILLQQTKNLAIIGNSSLSKDFSLEIEKKDVVVRFNEMKNYGVNTGKKTDIWVISSNKFLLDQHIKNGMLGGEIKIKITKMIEDCKYIFFCIPPYLDAEGLNDKNRKNVILTDKINRIEAVHNFVETYDINELSYRILEFPQNYVDELAPYIWKRKWICPSNGYLITRTIVDDYTYSNYKKTLYGFSWNGWEGHPWVLERLFLEKFKNEKYIEIK
jgi:hypothetical protein